MEVKKLVQQPVSRNLFRQRRSPPKYWGNMMEVENLFRQPVSRNLFRQRRSPPQILGNMNVAALNCHISITELFS